jgi:hypothetical protein
MKDAYLVQRASRREHGYQSRVLGIDVREAEERAWGEFGSNRGEVGEGPDSIVEDSALYARVAQLPAFTTGKLGRPYQLARHRFYLSRGGKSVRKAVLELLVHIILQLVREIATVREGQYAYFTLFHIHLVDELVWLKVERSRFKD